MPNAIHYSHCCKKCGGNMVGDGYTLVRHCEFADVDDDPRAPFEADADPIYCNYEEDVKNDKLSDKS